MFPNNTIKYFVFLTLQLAFSTIFCQISYKEAFPNISFNFPVEIQNSSDSSDRIFVVEQPGLKDSVKIVGQLAQIAYSYK